MLLLLGAPTANPKFQLKSVQVTTYGGRDHGRALERESRDILTSGDTRPVATDSENHTTNKNLYSTSAAEKYNLMTTECRVFGCDGTRRKKMDIRAEKAPVFEKV